MFDVVIVGGGPVGLFLACELKLAGVDPVVLERLPEASQADKAHGLVGQVVRLLDHRGLFERCGGTGAPTPMSSFYFGAMPVPLHLIGPDHPLFFLPIHQRDLERVLGERAIELGVDVRREHEVCSLVQSDDHVELLTVGPGGTVTGLSARFVVGCDGGHSMIRKQSGIAFPGILNEQVVARTALVAPTEQIRPVSTDPTRTMLRGRILIEGFGEIDGIFHRTERGVIAVALSGPDHVLINTLEWEDHPAGDSPGSGAPMTLAELEASVERVLGVRIRLASPPEGSPSLLRRVCGRNTRLAERYRDRRVFLAGDAAHVHAASGGPGLNLGLQDAANLAWKLAAHVHGWAPDGLLDSYETERRPLGQPLLLDLTEGAEVAAAASPWSGRVVRVPGRATAPPAPALLIRPDGYVAWAGTDPDGLRAALARWFGQPHERSAVA